MYGDLLLDRLSVKFLGPAPLQLPNHLKPFRRQRNMSIFGAQGSVPSLCRELASFSADGPEGKRVPKNLLAPAKPPTKKAKPPPKSTAQSIPVEIGEHVQEFKTHLKCSIS